ncbi:MAG: Ig-like domain-containing protein [Chloroflexi bacterium]|nr:Ig-like domain-containing protein [Chloroflexota bacterium]
MRKSIAPLIVISLMLLVLLAACRRGQATEELPTAVPTAALPQPTNEPTRQPTAVPQPAQSAVDPADIDWPPQVIYSSPSVGEEVLLDGAITLRFDQPMDQNSVAQALAVQNVADDTAVSGSLTWSRPDTVIFTPAGQLNRQQTYRVMVGETAKGANGQAMSAPAEFDLQTIGALAVAQVIPANGTTGVAADGTITVLFNRPVVPLVTTDQQARLPQPLTFNPPVEGKGEWTSTSIYRFTPSVAMNGASNYQVTVNAGLEDVTGALLESDYTWRFATAAPEVVRIQIGLEENRSEGAPVRPTEAITVTFNMPMNRAATQSAISVRGVDAPAATLRYAWSDGDRVVTLTADPMLQLATDYQVVVATSAQAAASATNLSEQAIKPFTTVPFPAVRSTEPKNEATPEVWQRGFSVTFASPMDIATLEDRVVIEPAPRNPRYSFGEWDGFQMYLDFPLERSTTYRITIPGSAADPYGNTLGRDYTFQFTTPAASPLASFNLPGAITQLSTSFETAVNLIYRNVSQVTVNLYDVGLPIQYFGDSYNLYDYLPNTDPLRTWSLNPSGSGVESLSLADGGALPTGIYFLSARAPEVSDDFRYWQLQRVMLIVADTNLVVKEMPNEVRVWATNIASGQPGQGLTITLYDVNGAPSGTAVTDASGFARFDYTRSPNSYGGSVTVVSSAPGQTGFGVANSRWNGGFEPWRMGISQGYNDTSLPFAYLYTDRPIYRPGDTVHYKGIVRDPNFGRFSLPNLTKATVRITPVNYYSEGGIEEMIPVTLDSDGVFYGEWVIPDDAPLGALNIYMEGQDWETMRSFSVAEYRAPEFLISMTADNPEALRGETVNVTLQADYFFGGSAADLNVTWAIYEDAFYPTVDGPYYAFGDNGGLYYEDFGPWGRIGGGGGTYGRWLTSGEGKTDANGRVTITLPASLLQDAENGSRKVTVEASVSDLAEFPVTSQTAVTFHAAAGYVGVRSANYSVMAGTEAAVELLTVDWSGAPLPNQNVSVTFYRREWESDRTSDFGQYYTRWIPVDTELTQVDVTTDAQGRATASFTPDEGGSYLAVATLTDGRGRQQTATTGLWAMDENFSDWRSAPREYTLDLVADQPSYSPGDTARILVQSPFAGTVNAWLTIERGNMIEQRVVQVTGGQIIEIPITPIFAPNVYVGVTAVKPVNPTDETRPYADIRTGMIELSVSPEQQELLLTLTPRETELEPGDTAVFDIQVTNFAGQPAQAELSLALVDLAVLTLKPDNAPPILDAFYAEQPLYSYVGAGLLVSGEGLAIEVPEEFLGGGGGGGGDVTEAALSRAVGDEDDNARRDFPDTAYWQAKLFTDGGGQATVEIPLPDTLTTWRLSSKVVNNDSLVGQSNVDIVVSLPLLVRPVTPRFFTVGDVVQIGAIVNNLTGAAIEATVSLEADGFVEASFADQVVSVPANGRTLVRWPVTVDDVEFADLTFRVAGGGHSDATKPSFGVGPDNVIPVYRYSAPDIVGTSGVLEEPGRQIEAILLPANIDTRRGSVDVQISASLAAAMIDALEALNDEYYQSICASSVIDRLLPNTATARAITELGLDEAALLAQLDGQIIADISQLEGLLKPDGGWGWCFSAESQPWLTAYGLLALTKAEEAGYGVNAGVLRQATSYLQRELRSASGLDRPWQANRQAFFLYVLAERGVDVVDEANALFAEQRGLLDPYAKAFLILAYEANAFASENQATLLADLNDAVIFSATGAHWEDAAQDFDNLNSDIRGTAIVLDALARTQPTAPFAPQTVNWLMVARTAVRWSTGHETAWSILALTDWLAATEELDANYDWALTVNLQPAAAGFFSEANVTERVYESIPMNQLVVGDTNFLGFERGSGDGRLYYNLHLNAYLPAESVQSTNRGIIVQRAYYDAACDPTTTTCLPINSIAAGGQVRVELTIIAPNNLLYAVVSDPLPSGAEGIDPGLETTSNRLSDSVERTDQTDNFWGWWGWWAFNRIEYRDERVVFYADFLPAGTYQYTYYLQANIPGAYQVMPTLAQQEFFPEVFGRTDGMLFTITE